MEIKKSSGITFTLIIFSVIFFGWGLLTSLNGVLVGHLNQILDLTDFQNGLINFTFFATYFFVSLVFFLLSQKKDVLNSMGYKYLTLVGLSIAAIGAYLFYPASALLSFNFFLIALIVLAAGITLLQIAANSYIVQVARADHGASRLTLVQALNSLGATLGPAVGALLIVETVELSGAELALLSSTELISLKKIQGIAVQLPYWVIATSLFALASLIFFLPMPDIKKERVEKVNEAELGMRNNIVLATIGIFVYVGAEVTIGANLGRMIDNGYPGLQQEKAFLISSYWGLAMIGRFLGGAILKLVNSGLMLTVFALFSVLLISLSIIGTGEWTIYALVGIGFFNSIMFPSIFASGIYKLQAQTGRGASLLIMAIAGGAVIPLMYNFLVPVAGAQGALIIAAVCYAYIAYYGRFFQGLSTVKSI